MLSTYYCTSSSPVKAIDGRKGSYEYIGRKIIFHASFKSSQLAGEEYVGKEGRSTFKNDRKKRIIETCLKICITKIQQ